MNEVMKVKFKEVVISYLKVLFQHLSEMTETKYESLIQI
jgi:hypothetical protein